MLALVFPMAAYPQAYSGYSQEYRSSTASQFQKGTAGSAIAISCLQLLLSWVHGGSLEPLLVVFNLLAALTCTWYWLGPFGELTLIYIEMVLIVPPLLIQLLTLGALCCWGK